jgi:PAS domain S-box-containing protein
MKWTLRQRILLTLVPVFVLLCVLGGAGAVLLYHLGGRIDDILRENYDSIVYMKDLNEAVERIDSSFHITLAGRPQSGHRQYTNNWQKYLENLHKEENNITIPGEGDLVKELQSLTKKYRAQGDAFYSLLDDPKAWPGVGAGVAGLLSAALGSGSVLTAAALLQPKSKEQRSVDYLRPGGLLDTFHDIKKVSEAIHTLNEKNMYKANTGAKETARASLIGFAVGLALVIAVAVILALSTVRTILRPIRAVTESALAIGAGDLNQVVPVMSRDELGQLASAFNTMARQLRDYRQSHQTQLFRAQQTSQATINSFPHPVLVVDVEGRVELANPAACGILGVRADGALHKTPVAWQPPEPLRRPLEEALHHQRAYLPTGFDQAVALRDAGKERFFLPRLLPIRDPYGATLGAAVLLEDVTRFRLLDEVKSNLVATVSHELKTPLTSIRLAVHLLLEETVGPLTAKQLELLLDARDNSERLLAMINNLLDLARLEEGGRQLELRPEQPAALLKAAAEAIRPRAEDEGVEVVVEEAGDLPPVAADFRQLGHALHNLLDNALRYTPKGGRITLKAEASDDTVTLTVADTGSGIPPEFMPHVFERFFRVPGPKQQGGTGLGLAIVREIVTAHGGTVTCESRPGAGTVFRLTLKRFTEENAERASELATDETRIKH